MLLIASPDFFKLTISIIPDFVEQNGPLLLTDTELEIRQHQVHRICFSLDFFGHLVVQL